MFNPIYPGPFETNENPGGGPIGPPAINKSENNKTYVLRCFLNYMYFIRPHDKI